MLNGVESGLDDSLGRGSCVLKEEPASFPGSVATELGDDYGSVAPEEESVSEEVWYDCRQSKSIWHDCVELEEIANQTPTPSKTAQPTLVALPCVFMVFSGIMLSMYVVGMVLRAQGLSWRTGWMCFLPCLFPIMSGYVRLKLYWWPPPSRKVPEKEQKDSMTRKKLMLTALSVAVLKAGNAAPVIEFSDDRALRKTVRCAKGRAGVLATAKLKPDGAVQVRKALEALPAYLYHPGDTKFVVIDSGASETVTGDKSNLVAGSLKPIELPRLMDRMDRSISGTWATFATKPWMMSRT